MSANELQKEIKSLENRINKLELEIKNNTKSKKTKKDPNAPKKPVTGYMYFNKYKIDEYKKKHPGQKINITSISKQSGEEWKNLKENEKDKYLKMAIKDKKRYEKEIIIYNKK